MIKHRKRATESFVVALNTAGSMPVTGTLVDSATGNVNLTTGQLGIIATSTFGTVAPNAFMDATPTIAENQSIAIVQGTSASASINTASASYPLSVRPYERTASISGRSPVLVTKQPFTLARHNVWTIGNTSAATSGTINVLDETEYRLYLAFSSRRLDEKMATQFQAASLNISITTPDFSALSSTIPLPIDWIVTNFAYEINRNSSVFLQTNRFQGTDPVLAFIVGIANSGPSGAAAGTAISGLTAGSTLGVFVQGTVTRSITLTAEMVDSLQAAATASGFTHVFTIDKSNAGTNVGGTATGIFVVGADAKTAFVDYIPQLKTRVRVGLNAGFDYKAVRVQESAFSGEGQGYGRALDLLYQETQGQRKYMQRHVSDPVINYPSPVDTNQQYTVYNIMHGSSEQIDTSNMVYSPYRELILIPRYSTGTTTNPLIALVDTALNSYLASGSNPAIQVI
jgi:hypothetical protein